MKNQELAPLAGGEGTHQPAEFAEALDLLKLAQGHMLQLAADESKNWQNEAVIRHNALTKRVFEFLRAHSTDPQAVRDPSL